MFRASVLSAALLLACAGLDPADLEGLLQAAQSASGGALDEGTVAAGLKEALQVGTKRAVDVTSRSGGFGLNDLIRIETPEQLQPMTDALRMVGLGGRVDELEASMNRAAELAAGEATDVFWDAITKMSISDAVGILNGDQTAATDYFRDRSTAQLTERFRPIVNQKMQEVGLYQSYQQLTSAYASLPMASKPSLDLEEYVTDNAVGGLFTVLGQEEAKIRSDPGARSTELLRKVFGG